MSPRRFSLAAVAAALLASRLLAHDPGLSTAEWTLGPTALRATLTFHPGDLDGLLDPAAPSVFLASAVRVACDETEVTASRVEAGRDGKDNVLVGLTFPVLPAAEIRLRCAGLASLPLGHRQYAIVRDDAGATLAEALLDARACELRIAPRCAAPSAGTPFWRFLVLGVEHILTGFDHLAFLLALILGSRGPWRLAGTVTAFTVAHSLTLALAALQVVRLSPAIVEPLIALSIVYVALENLLRREPGRRWLVTLGFGLVHGLGFASLLGELLGESGAHGVLGPLVAFNLGVEAGQLGALALVLPGAWLLARRPALSRRVAAVASAAVAAAGLLWLLQRTLL